MSDSQMRVEQVFAEAARLFESKNLHYGDSWREQGWRGNISRILEKAKRLRTMLWRGGNTLLNGSKEHPRETLLDVINTCAFAIINMDDGVEWGHEPRHGEVVIGRVDMSLEEFQRSMGNPAIQQSDYDSVQVRVPTPGEETIVEQNPLVHPPESRQKPSPNPRKRGGSGPRPVVDRPQA